MKMPGFLIAALLLITPTAALAARGIVTTNVNLRAGPSTGFPVVDRIPNGAHVTIHGCIKGDSWCDVSWNGDRGWVSAQSLEYFYRNRYVYLPDYVDEIDVPIVPFVVGTYWANYYTGRPFYRRRAYWTNYWQTQARFVTRLPDRDRRGLAVRQGRGPDAGVANTRGARVSSERVGPNRTAERVGPNRTARENERRGAMRAMREPRGGNRFSAAPAREPAARRDRDVGHAGEAAAQARGRFGGSRAMGAMPQHAGPAAAPRMGGAPRGMGAMGAMPHPGPDAGPAAAAPHMGGGSPRAMGAMGAMPHGGPAAAPHMGGGGAPHMGGGGGAPHGGGGPAGGGHGGGPGRPH